jgi:Tfp pilus assembly protein PilV
MRHYIALSWEHLARKYQSRRYSPEEVTERAWHGARARFDPGTVRGFDWSRMKRVERPGEWDRSDPWLAHPMFPRTKRRVLEP